MNAKARVPLRAYNSDLWQRNFHCIVLIALAFICIDVLH